MTAVPTNSDSSTGFFTRLGSWLTLNGSPALIFGTAKKSTASSATVNAAMQANVMRQPRAKPMTRPKGKPRIWAIEEPVTMAESAIERCSSETAHAAMEGAIDQKIACAHATMRRAPMSGK